MALKNLVARVIDVSKNNVTFFAGAEQYTVQWPDDKIAVGDIYLLDLEPSLTVHKKIGQATEHAIDWPNSDTMRWRKPTKSGMTRMEILKQRHVIKRVVRDYLHEQGFIEIDMPLLVNGTTPDAEIDSFESDGRNLVTSCEYQIKRMEIGGFDKPYTFTQNFRVSDHGRYRNPEFTMIEWARVGETLKDIEDDAEQFLIRGHQALNPGKPFVYQGHIIDITPPWDRITVRDAIQKHIGVSLNDFTAPSLLKAAEAAAIDVKEEWKNDPIFLFSLVLEHLQTKLGFDKPVFLQEWPKLMTASADIDKTGNFTQRSELFIAGVELSDGFPSLTDYDRQQQGFRDQVQRRRDHGSVSVALDEKFLLALREGFGAGAGMALGFDRLVMLLTDQDNIRDVLAFSWDEL